MQEAFFFVFSGIFFLFRCLVKNRLDGGAVIVQGGRHDENVVHSCALLHELADIRVQCFNFTNLGRCRGDVKAKVVRLAIACSKVWQRVDSVCNRVLHLVQKRVLRKILCGAVVVFTAAHAEIEIVIDRLAPKLDVVAAGTAPVAEQRVFGFRFFVAVFGNVVNVRAFACVGIVNGHLFANVVKACAVVFPLPVARFPVPVDVGVLVVYGRCVFPEFHARVLDVSVNVVRFGVFLQNHAIELAHTTKAENK